MADTQELTQEARFVDFPFSEVVLRDIAEAGWEKPTPIQAGCIGPALEGKDIIGLAQTGTGKTAAFALPIIQKLARRAELAALVLAPTRELAQQITGQFNLLGKSSGIRVATIVGGVAMELDWRALRSWPNVLVATPGRLIDHIQQGTVSLKEIEVLVVDEADRMHDMGFIPQIRRILAELPRNRQTLMFTATMPKDVEQVIVDSMTDPVRVQIGRRSAPAAGATQQLFAVREDEKTPLLLKLLAEHKDGRVLVFVRTKRGVDRLHRSVVRRFAAARIHGDREQAERDEAMEGFRSGRYRVLIATDIAARGLDISGIEHVINYDFPLQAEDYVHRIGRTARQEAKGLASSFVTPADRRYLQDVRRLLGDKLPVPEALSDLLGRRKHRQPVEVEASHDHQAPRPTPSSDVRPADAPGDTATGERRGRRRRRRRGRGSDRREGAESVQGQQRPSHVHDRPVQDRGRPITWADGADEGDELAPVPAAVQPSRETSVAKQPEAARPQEPRESREPRNRPHDRHPRRDAEQHAPRDRQPEPVVQMPQVNDQPIEQPADNQPWYDGDGEDAVGNLYDPDVASCGRAACQVTVHSRVVRDDGTGVVEDKPRRCGTRRQPVRRRRRSGDSKSESASSPAEPPTPHAA